MRTSFALALEGVPGQFGEGLDGTRCREPFEEIGLHLDVKGVLHVVVGLRWRTSVQQVVPLGICTRDESIGLEREWPLTSSLASTPVPFPVFPGGQARPFWQRSGCASSAPASVATDAL